MLVYLDLSVAGFLRLLNWLPDNKKEHSSIVGAIDQPHYNTLVWLVRQVINPFPKLGVKGHSFLQHVDTIMP